MLLIIVSLCPLPPKPLITCPHVFFLWCDPVLKKNHGEGRVCGEMVVEYQKSLMGFLICQLSSILSIFLNQEFSFCTQMEPSFDFWLLLKIHWLQNTKPPSMSSKKEKLCGFFGGWRRVSGAVSSSCDSVHLSVLLFCTCIVLVGSTLSVCYTARRVPDDGSGSSSDRVTQAAGFQQSLGSSFQPLVQSSICSEKFCLPQWWILMSF